MSWFRKLLGWEGDKPSQVPPSGSPATGYDWRAARKHIRDVVKVEQGKWQELGISPAEADNVGEIFGVKLNPFQLESLAFNFNSDLAQRGFNFALTPKDMLGTLVDQEVVNRRRRESGKPIMSALEVAIWREADRLIRKENALERSVNLPTKMLQERVKKICEAAERKPS